MSGAAANFLVVVIVAASCCYCVWRLGPRRLRESLRVRCGKFLPGIFGSSAGIATSACDTCGGCELANRNSRFNRNNSPTLTR